MNIQIQRLPKGMSLFLLLTEIFMDTFKSEKI